jgi:hypothetical protein
MPRDRSKLADAARKIQGAHALTAAAQAGQGGAPRSSPPRKAVDESVDAPAESERTQLMDDATQQSVVVSKDRDDDIPEVEMPDVKVAKVTINEEPKTSSCCYCCCFETGLYWE